MTEPPMLLGIDQAALTMGIGRSKCYQLIRRGELASLVIGRRRLVPRQAIDDFIRKRLSDCAPDGGSEEALGPEGQTGLRGGAP